MPSPPNGLNRALCRVNDANSHRVSLAARFGRYQRLGKKEAAAMIGASAWRDRLSAAQHALAAAEHHFPNEREIALLRRKVEEPTEEGQRREFAQADEPREEHRGGAPAAIKPLP